MDRQGASSQKDAMAAQQGTSDSPLRALEEALGMGLAAAGDAEGTYYLEQVTVTEASEDDCEYEEIPDDNFSIPEGEEDLAKAIQMVQEQVTDTQILEQKTVLPSKPVVPEVIEDFLCNFLIKMGMTRTLDCFQSEWYELIQKGATELTDVGKVPDIYTQYMLLENENKNLKNDLKHYRQAADKAKECLLKTQKERDFHRMHHRRIVQEKNKLINDFKGLKLHYASYEPTIRVLLEKHHTLLRQKMLTSLERDQAVEQVKRLSQISGLRTTIRNVEPGQSYQASKIGVVPDCERERAPEEPAQRGLREAREQNKYKTKMKDDTKDSEFPIYMQPNPNQYFYKENDCPAKFDYTLNTIFRLHELPVSCLLLMTMCIFTDADLCEQKRGPHTNPDKLRGRPAWGALQTRRPQGTPQDGLNIKVPNKSPSWQVVTSQSCSFFDKDPSGYNHSTRTQDHRASHCYLIPGIPSLCAVNVNYYLSCTHQGKGSLCLSVLFFIHSLETSSLCFLPPPYTTTSDFI
ncbi:sperm-associated antigen 16 protein isoform 5-T6 [Molossus nigricans]